MALDEDRPRWLTEPCPPWCARTHHEDDHPEDWVHQDQGVVISVLRGVRSVEDMSLHPVAGELLVRRSRRVGDGLTWLTLAFLEGGGEITVEVSVLPRLLDALAGL